MYACGDAAKIASDPLGSASTSRLRRSSLLPTLHFIQKEFRSLDWGAWPMLRQRHVENTCFENTVVSIRRRISWLDFFCPPKKQVLPNLVSSKTQTGDFDFPRYLAQCRQNKWLQPGHGVCDLTVKLTFGPLLASLLSYEIA